MEDMTPASTFPLKEVETTYLTYYQERYGITIKNASQPLIHAQGKKIKGKATDVYLIPELCSLTGLTDEVKIFFKFFR
jgi:hypothetical protein